MVRLFQLLNKRNQVLLKFVVELISCLGRTHVRAFHENPDRIHTELTFIIPRQSRRDIVLASSVHSVRPSVRPYFCLSGTISQYLLVRFDSFLVQMISTINTISYKFSQNRPLNT